MSLAFVGMSLWIWQASLPYIPLHPSGGFVENGEYASRNVRELQGRRFGSWNGSDANVGELVSDPFIGGPAVTFLVDGYPAHPGETISLERTDSGEQHQFTFAREPGEAWTRVTFPLPAKWIGRSVRIRCVDSSREFQGWIGIAEVRTALVPFTFPEPWYPVAWSLVALVAVLACWPLWNGATGRIASVFGSSWTFCAALGSALLWTRLPSITAGQLLNADEAQMTAQAITFLHHPIPWVDFDGTTSGPLNSMVVSLPALFGKEPTLADSRFIGTLLVLTLLTGLYLSVRRLWGELPARLSVLSPFALLCSGGDGSYISYVSELLPLSFVAVAMVCIAELVAGSGRNIRCAAVLGLSVGAVPFAKLQAAPVAFLLIMVAAIALYAQAARAGRSTTFLAMGAGLLAIPLVILTAVAAAGGLHDFYISYIVFPRVYVAGNCCNIAGLSFFLQDPPFAAFFYSAFLAFTIATVGWLALIRRARRSDQLSKPAIALVISIATGIVALASIEAPQTPFLHYLLLLLPGITCAVGTMQGAFLTVLRAAPVPRSMLPASAIAFVCIAFAPLTVGSIVKNPYLDHDAFVAQSPADGNAERLREIIGGGRRVAMWGWAPQYLVYSVAIMGTRDSISQFQIEPRPFRDYFRARYLRDFQKNQPDFVLEAIGPTAFAYHDRRTQGIETFPLLDRIVETSYRPAFQTDSIRLWERRQATAVR